MIVVLLLRAILETIIDVGGDGRLLEPRGRGHGNVPRNLLVRHAIGVFARAEGDNATRRTRQVSFGRPGNPSGGRKIHVVIKAWANVWGFYTRQVSGIWRADRISLADQLSDHLLFKLQTNHAAKHS